MKDILYADIDDVLEKAVISEEMFDDVELRGGRVGDGVILTYGDTYRVTDKGVIFVEGTYCNYDEETGELEPDWSLTVLYEDVPDGDFDKYSFLGYEQDAPAVAIHNFIRFVEEQCLIGGIEFDTTADAVHRYAELIAEQDSERSDEADEEKIAYMHSAYADALCG